MANLYFIDTNVVVYLLDKTAPQKQAKARQLLIDLIQDGRAVMSYQVIQEFCHVALHKMADRLTISDCQIFVETWLVPLVRVHSSEHLFVDGLSIKSQTGYQWYDSLMLAAALQAKCSVFYSEDLQHQGLVRGMKIVNPFV